MSSLNLQQHIQARIQRSRTPPSPAAPQQPGNGAPSHEDAKKLLDTSATTNRNLFIAFNLLLTTALILCLSVTDEQLLLDSTPIPLVFINVSPPTWAFASILPLIVLVVHFDLLHNLNEHSKKLQTWVRAWEKKFPPATAETPASAENVQLTTLLFPFLYDFAWLHAKGRGPNSINRNLLPTLCWLLYCWAPYSVLLIFLIRFLDIQSYFYTGWHLALVILDVAFMVWYWPKFGTAQSRIRVWRWMRIFINVPVVMLFLSTLIAIWSFTLYCLILRHLTSDGSAEWVEQAIQLEVIIKPTYGLTLVPRIVMPGYRVKLDANHFTLAEIHAPGKNKAELWFNTAVSAKLSRRRLGFADFSYAHMQRADFSHANLKGAKMFGAQLQGVYLLSAQLQGADLRFTHLQNAYLHSAHLQNAALRSAQLQGADLRFAWLQGSDLRSTQLQGTYLRDTKLQGADLRFAQLQGADLGSSDLQGADLSYANLQGAYLSSTTIKGSVLEGAELSAVSLPESKKFAATSGQVAWYTSFNSSEIKDSTWFQVLPSWRKQEVAKRIKSAEQRAKIFTIPDNSASDNTQFREAWLEVLCQEAAIAKKMLQNDLFRYLPKEVSDLQLRQWIQANVKCEPYRALAEMAMADRKAENHTMQKNLNLPHSHFQHRSHP